MNEGHFVKRGQLLVSQSHTETRCAHTHTYTNTHSAAFRMEKNAFILNKEVSLSSEKNKPYSCVSDWLISFIYRAPPLAPCAQLPHTTAHESKFSDSMSSYLDLPGVYSTWTALMGSVFCLLCDTLMTRFCCNRSARHKQCCAVIMGNSNLRLSLNGPWQVPDCASFCGW